MKEPRELKANSVMVLSAAAATGHLRAADALVSAFTARGVSARHIEVLRYTNPIFRKIYSDLYIDLMTRGPDLLGWLYKTFDRPWQFQKRRLALDRLNTGPMVKMIRQENPDLVLCTHFLPAEILLYLRKKRVLHIPIGVVVTDIDAHAMWLLKNVDWYFVASEETRVYLAALGIPSETIFVTGIPIDPVFGEQKPKRETRLHLGLHPDKTTILVSVGGFGVGPVETLVHALDEIRHPVQIAVICGRNPRLEGRLKILPPSRHPMKIVGFTREMDSWMAAADLLVGKPGGLTSSEALARGLVLVIVNPIPGQEERNSDHFLEEGVAIRCNNLPALAYKIDTLLADQERFLRMQQAVKRMARPDAASEVVSTVLKAKV
ncbi:MAG TPA: glycosyltransferase [Thermodesulfobacteriota bacterium]|nr:glycosyltransferase [Thermodesulfobacteriota bacterium]